MTGEILSVGTELLLGQIINTNAAFIARYLADAGINLYSQRVVGDNPARLLRAWEEAFAAADFVIATGGLGPTEDDLTKETCAQYFGLPLHTDQKALADIEKFFHHTHLPFTVNNRKQAEVPEGAYIFYNARGTAPGLAVEKDGKTAILLPGPPHEMEPMFLEQVLPYLQEKLQRKIRSHTLRLFGIGESHLETLLPAHIRTGVNPTAAPYAKRGEVELRITASGISAEECEEKLTPVLKELTSLLAPYVYGTDVPDLQTVLVTELQKKQLTIATAESCTGGLLSQCITQVPGASTVFGLGVCTYSNEMKKEVLGIREETLASYGAVSAQTAAQMAENVRRLAGADIGLSTTGIAGPDGGTPQKPVGTVYIGIASSAGTRILHPRSLRSSGADVREWNRHMTMLHALSAVWKLITKGEQNGR